MPERTDEAESRAVLESWRNNLVTELKLPDASIDIDGVLGLAGTVAHALVRPAAPLTTYIVGYAVGRLVEQGAVTDEEAFAAVAAVAKKLAATAGAQ